MNIKKFYSVLLLGTLVLIQPFDVLTVFKMNVTKCTYPEPFVYIVAPCRTGQMWGASPEWRVEPNEYESLPTCFVKWIKWINKNNKKNCEIFIVGIGL